MSTTQQPRDGNGEAPRGHSRLRDGARLVGATGTTRHLDCGYPLEDDVRGVAPGFRSQRTIRVRESDVAAGYGDQPQAI